MDQDLIFWPAIIQAGITLCLYIILFRRRMASVKAGEADIRDFKLPSNQTENVEKAARNLTNQFELPVLFLILLPMLHLSDNVNFLQLFLAFFFNLTRVVHLAVHVTSNKLKWRMQAFTAGFMTLVLMWGVFAFSMLDIL